MNSLADLGRFGLFSARTLWCLVTPPWELHESARHTWLILLRCILPVVAVVFPMGMVMALQALGIFALFGTPQLLPALVSVAVLRELSPVLATALVTAQGGTSFAAELGAMRIKEELDATEVMAVDPVRVHVVPRVVAALIATPMLNLAGSIAGIAGGAFTTVLLKGQMTREIYFAEVWTLTQPGDLVGGLVKAAVFGLLIGLLSTYQGFHATGGAAGVGRAVNNTAVHAITAVVVVNYFLSNALFGAMA